MSSSDFDEWMKIVNENADPEITITFTYSDPRVGASNGPLGYALNVAGLTMGSHYVKGSARNSESSVSMEYRAPKSMFDEFVETYLMEGDIEGEVVDGGTLHLSMDNEDYDDINEDEDKPITVFVQLPIPDGSKESGGIYSTIYYAFRDYFTDKDVSNNVKFKLKYKTAKATVPVGGKMQEIDISNVIRIRGDEFYVAQAIEVAFEIARDHVHAMVDQGKLSKKYSNVDLELKGHSVDVNAGPQQLQNNQVVEIQVNNGPNFMDDDGSDDDSADEYLARDQIKAAINSGNLSPEQLEKLKAQLSPEDLENMRAAGVNLEEKDMTLEESLRAKLREFMEQDEAPQPQSNRYDYKATPEGGVILYDLQTGQDGYLQPGDDANTFFAELEAREAEGNEFDDEFMEDNGWWSVIGHDSHEEPINEASQRYTIYLEDSDFRELRQASQRGRFSHDYTSEVRPGGRDVTFSTINPRKLATDLEKIIDFGAITAGEALDMEPEYYMAYEGKQIDEIIQEAEDVGPYLIYEPLGKTYFRLVDTSYGGTEPDQRRENWTADPSGADKFDSVEDAVAATKPMRSRYSIVSLNEPETKIADAFQGNKMGVSESENPDADSLERVHRVIPENSQTANEAPNLFAEELRRLAGLE